MKLAKKPDYLVSIRRTFLFCLILLPIFLFLFDYLYISTISILKSPQPLAAYVCLSWSSFSLLKFPEACFRKIKTVVKKCYSFSIRQKRWRLQFVFHKFLSVTPFCKLDCFCCLIIATVIEAWLMISDTDDKEYE